MFIESKMKVKFIEQVRTKLSWFWLWLFERESFWATKFWPTTFSRKYWSEKVLCWTYERESFELRKFWSEKVLSWTVWARQFERESFGDRIWTVWARKFWATKLQKVDLSDKVTKTHIIIYYLEVTSQYDNSESKDHYAIFAKAHGPPWSPNWLFLLFFYLYPLHSQAVLSSPRSKTVLKPIYLQLLWSFYQFLFRIDKISWPVWIY